MTKEFLFDTGVKYSDYPYLSKGQTLNSVGTTKKVVFYCSNVPDNAIFKYAANSPDLDPNLLCVPIEEGSYLLSKFAYFQVPHM